MSKIVDGVELLRMIRDGEIKNGTIIQVIYPNNYRISYTFKHNCLYEDGREIGNSVLLGGNMFEILLEEDKEIDIQSLQKLNRNYFNMENFKYAGEATCDMINDLIKAIKQLDKKIKE